MYLILLSHIDVFDIIVTYRCICFQNIVFRYRHIWYCFHIWVDLILFHIDVFDIVFTYLRCPTYDIIICFQFQPRVRIFHRGGHISTMVEIFQSGSKYLYRVEIFLQRKKYFHQGRNIYTGLIYFHGLEIFVPGYKYFNRGIGFFPGFKHFHPGRNISTKIHIGHNILFYCPLSGNISTGVEIIQPGLNVSTWFECFNRGGNI